MKKQELENIIIKAANNKATTLELAVLEEAIKVPENKALFESYIQSSYILDSQFKTFDSNAAKAKFLERIETSEVKLKISSRKRSLTILKYAAVIALIFLVKNTLMPGNTVEVISQDAITLELNDGTIKIINLGSNQEVVNSNGFVLLQKNSDKLVYDNSSAANKETKLSYNELHVPFAKKFQVELSDGTLVYLNSGSTLKYPVKFLNGKSREVFLDGEAYFVVSKDKNHPFIVNANEISTQVYGTEFNISSYKNDTNLDIVLVEGSIGVYNNLKNEKQLLLVPNEKASFIKKDLKFAKETVDAKKLYSMERWCFIV